LTNITDAIGLAHCRPYRKKIDCKILRENSFPKTLTSDNHTKLVIGQVKQD